MYTGMHLGVDWLALGIEAGNQNVRLEVQKGKFCDPLPTSHLAAE